MDKEKQNAFADRFGGIKSDTGRKATLLRAVCIAFLCIIPFGFVLDSLRHSMSAWAEGCAIPLFIISLVVLYHNEYKKAAYIASITIACFAISLCLIIDEATVTLLYANIGYYMIALTVMELFVSNTLSIDIAGVMFAITQLIFAIFILSPKGIPLPKVLPDTFGSLLVFALGYFFVRMIAVLSARFQSDLNQERLNLQNQMDKMSQVLTGTSATMQSLENITSQATAIRSLVSDSGASINSITGKVNVIGNGADKSLAATNTIGTQITELNKHIQNEAAAREESSASINQMVTSIKTVADSAQNEKEIMATLGNTSAEGAKQLEVLLSNIGDIAGSIDEIQNMVSVINNIATQTNLLSMNAAIEAAHAGASGRGFTVVAEEIRKLADTSAKNAKDIKKQLKDVIARIQNASTNSTGTKDSFARIQDEIAKSNASFDEIANATSELSLGGQEIITAIKTLSEMSTHIDEGGKQIGLAQKSLEANAQQLKTSLQELSSEATTVVDKNKQILVAVDPIEQIAKEGASHAAEIQNCLK